MSGSRARSVRDMLRILLSRRTPRRECWAAQQLFELSCYTKAKLRLTLLLPQRPIASFRAYRGSIELLANPTRIASMRRNER